VAASAETANDATRAAASVEISTFFMVVSPLPPNASETSQQTFSFRLFSCQSVQKSAEGMVNHAPRLLSAISESNARHPDDDLPFPEVAHVCFGSEADMCGAKSHVRFTRESGHFA